MVGCVEVGSVLGSCARERKSVDTKRTPFELTVEWNVFALLPNRQISQISPSGGRFHLPCIHPSGEVVVFQGGLFHERLRIWRAKIACGALSPLTSPQANSWMPAYSWKGDVIVFASDIPMSKKIRRIAEMPLWLPPEGYTVNLFVMDSDGKDIRQITVGDCQDLRPALSPDGRHVAFCSNRTGTWKIWVVPSDGNANPSLLKGSYEWAMRPWYARDGQSLFFHTDVDGRHRICRYWLVDGQIKPLPNDDEGMSHGASASANGGSLLMHSTKGGGSRIWRLPLDGSPAEEIRTPGFKLAGHATEGNNGVVVFDSPNKLPSAAKGRERGQPLRSAD